MKALKVMPPKPDSYVKTSLGLQNHPKFKHADDPDCYMYAHHRSEDPEDYELGVSFNQWNERLFIQQLREELPLDSLLHITQILDMNSEIDSLDTTKGYQVSVQTSWKGFRNAVHHSKDCQCEAIAAALLAVLEFKYPSTLKVPNV